jgi:hypothetical protein
MGGFKSNAARWLANETRVLKRAERAMGQVMLNRSTMIAPVESGGLVRSGRVEDNPLGGISVIFGDDDAPYARRRHFENKKNPQTLHYLKRGGDSVAKENPKKFVDMGR